MSLTIEASAGTGKTYELTTIVAAAIAGRDVIDARARGSGLIDSPEFARVVGKNLLQPSALLLTTYTDAAARELKERVRSRLVEVHRQQVAKDPTSRASRRLGHALSEVDVMSISTIHGFCARIIREQGFELGLAQAAVATIDEAELTEELAMRWWSSRVRDDAMREQLCADAGLGLKDLAAYVSEAIGSRGIELALPAAGGVDELIGDLMRFARAEVGESLRARGAMTFQDQLLLVLEGVRHSARLVELIRERYRLAIVDEAQDTDPVQLEIFARIFDEQGDADRLLVMVGDPKQSIYGFRGADLDAYLRMRGSGAPLRLDTNWRSEPGVVAAVNQLFGGQNPFRRASITHPSVHAATEQRHGTLLGAAPFEIAFGEPGVSAEVWTTRTLKSLLSCGATVQHASGARDLRWSDCAVLGTSNDALQLMDTQLRAAGVPTILMGDQSVLAGETVDGLRSILAACAEPGRARVVRRAMICSLVGVAATDLAAADADALVARWARRFAAWAEFARRGGVLGIVERALASALAPIESRTVTDALHLAELVHAEVGAGAWPSTMLMALERLVTLYADERTRPGDRTRRRIDRTDAVTLQTVHRSKGLEYGIVLMPWAGAPMVRPRTPLSLRIPSARVREVGDGITAPANVAPDESVLVPLPRGTKPPIVEERQSEEAIRLLYVGVTRARHAVRLFVAHAAHARGASALESLGVTHDANPWPPTAHARDHTGELAGSVGVPAGAPTRANALRRQVHPAIGRPVSVWVDRSFTRLTKSEHADAPELAASVPEVVERDDEPAPIVTRGALRGGRALGRIMHRIFEWAAREGADADVRTLTERAIAEAGAKDQLDAAVLSDLAERTRSADLAAVGGPTTTLKHVPPAQVAVELGFCIPLGHGRVLTPDALALACAEAPAGSPMARFAPHARRLHFGEVVGFLTGNVDLLFQHAGRWWIVDYKSNDLGERDEDYRPGRLVEAMVRDRYVLQYALYAVALRRLLALRGVDTSGDWLGGVIYPFVRGIDPREPGRGIFIDHPTPQALDALDALFRGPVMAARGAHA